MYMQHGRKALTFVTIMTTKPFSSILYSDIGWSSFNILPETNRMFQTTLLGHISKENKELRFGT